MAKKFPIHPARPERTCWGCDRYCAATAMQCGNGSVRTPHPVETFGDDWLEWGLQTPATDAEAPTADAPAPARQSPTSPLRIA